VPILAQKPISNFQILNKTSKLSGVFQGFKIISKRGVSFLSYEGISDTDAIMDYLKKERLSLGLLLQDSSIVERASLKTTVIIYALSELMSNDGLKFLAKKHLSDLLLSATSEDVIPIYIFAIKSSDSSLEEIVRKRISALLPESVVNEMFSIYSQMKIILTNDDDLIILTENNSTNDFSSESFSNSIAALAREMITTPAESA
jgi:hypothetical protein